KVRKTNPTIGQKARQTGRRMTTRAGQEFFEVGMDQDDTLSDLLRMKRQARQARVTAKQAGRATGKGARLAYRGGKGSVKIGAKGTQYAYEKARKGSLKATQASAKAASKATQVIATATKAIVNVATPIITNPLTWFISGVMGLLLLLIILVSSVFASNIIQQDEFTLNHSWL
ncbi:phage tail tip lysozyme, partial [Streptococcus pluranimalium]